MAMERGEKGIRSRAISPPAAEADAKTHSGSLLEHLRQQILDGQFQSGSRLNEVRLSKHLKVSHTPNKGFTVRDFPVSEIIDAYEMRALSEGLAARLAAERGLGDEIRQTLERALAEGDAVLAKRSGTKGQRGSYAAINEAFHSSILRAAGSDLVREVVRLCQRMPQASAHNVMAFELDDVRNRHEAHHRIYEAILGREPREAENQMRQHVLSVKLSMIRSIRR
jgi:GntR family transcriptional regulator of vanillate catabolism